MKRIIIALAALSAASFANAGLITVEFDGVNDCAGEFGDNFELCNVNGSPIIAKYDYDEDTVQINSLFPSVSADDFIISGGSTGDWSYSQEGADPDVRYWAAKGSNSFILHYMVADENDAACAGSASTTCLDLALAVTSGEYGTPVNPNNGNNFGLSHLSFYDTGTVLPVPEPGPLLMLSLGLLGLGLARRRSA